ncbi:hypothetical protein J6590_106877, partial [Homalodisca vitripennis]
MELTRRGQPPLRGHQDIAVPKNRNQASDAPPGPALPGEVNRPERSGRVDITPPGAAGIVPVMSIYDYP